MTSPVAAIPPGLTMIRRTAFFDERTIPAALRRNHRTAPDVWGMIRVVAGRLRLKVITPPGEFVIDPTQAGVVLPQQPHEVEPLGPVRFFIEFYGPAQSERGERAATPSAEGSSRNG
jgi:tellurite resistance-related uncharacterized protein